MNYENYSIEQFVADEEFRRWVKNPTKNDIVFWNNWLQCHPNRVQRVNLAREIILSMRFSNEDPSSADYEEVLHNILKSGNTEKSYNDHLHDKGVSRFIRYAVAASVMLLLSVGAYFVLAPNETVNEVVDNSLQFVVKENPPGVKSQIKLPDGTKVWLNASSKLLFPSEFPDDSRNVELIGEGYFEVKKDESSPFHIKTGNVVTTVLGTSFNIKSDSLQNQVQIALASGKVRVEQYNGKNEIISTQYLQPGQGASFVENQTPEIFLYHWDKVFGWKDNIIYFENAGRHEVLSKLENWYGVEIETDHDTSDEWDVTAKFKDQSLENVLENLSFTVGFDYEIDEKSIRLNLKQ